MFFFFFLFFCCVLHPLPLPLSSCLGCIPPLIGLPSLRFYVVASSLFLLSVCFCLCFSFLSRRCPLLATFLPVLFCLLSMLISDSRFDLVWFRLPCDHGWILSGSVNVRKTTKPQKQLYWSYLHEELQPGHSSERVIDPVHTIDPCRRGSHELPLEHKVNRYSQCRVRK